MGAAALKNKSEDLPRIFEPFYTTKAPGRGIGLGLSLTRRFVEENRGDIRVESEPGAGTAVFIWLPAPAADAPSMRNGAS